MQFNRRTFTFALTSFGLSACASGAQTVALAAQSIAADLLPQPNAGYDAWVTRFKSRASGISRSTLDAAFANAGYIPGVITRDRTQIQTRRTLDEYLSIATSDERVAKGRAAFARHAATFSAIEGRYGVDAKIIAGIWGMESTFGEKRGQIPVISATSTLAFEGRRGAFYESQLMAALRILERGDTTPNRLLGSWAGAMGHTQFIPTSFESFAVDFTGDGRRDVWGDDPTDALASTAAYLSRNGWRQGLAWGAEAGPGAPSGRTIQPQNPGIPFVVTRNFNVLKTYNNSDFYALGVGLLGDRIAGGGPLRGRFPPDANGLTRDDRLALQRGLVSRGYDIGTVDGVIGTKSEAAIRDFQTRQGLAVTGTPSVSLVQALR